jgi:diguanylate cyclase (GGDEF)-like protein/PAS domain S-box-containing protein
MTPVFHWPVRSFLIWLVLACLLPGVIGATILFIYQYQNGRAQLEQDTLQTARALVQAVDSHLLRTLAIAQTLSTRDSLARGDFANFHQRAREVMALTGLGTNAVLRDETGQQILNTSVEFGQHLPRQPISDPIRRVFATGKPSISDLFIGQPLTRRIMSVNVPVVINGKVAYALGVGILPEHFNAILKAQHLPSDWVVAVLDSTGTIVGRSHSPEQFIAKKTRPELLQAMKQSPEGTLDAATQEGTSVLAVYSLSPITRWGVAIGIPIEAIQAPLVRTLSMLAIGVAALFVVGLLLARLMGRKIADSVQALTVPALALGNGEPATVPNVSIKEVAEVGAAIGRAADLLKERAVALQARDAELAEAHRLAKFGSWYANLLTGEVKISDSAHEMVGRDIPSFSEMRGTLMPVESWEKLNATVKDVISTGGSQAQEVQVNHGSGDTIWVNFKIDSVLDKNGEVVALRGVTQDITERKLTEQRIHDAALHDSLTGLPNRAFVFEFCNRLLAAAHRGHGAGALLFIDLDRFKPINDLYGHEIGDRVLQEVSKRLTDCVRQEDLVGRLGGDEFVIVLPYVDVDRHRATIVARHVIDSISQPFRIDALELSISPSIGISCFPKHANDVSELIHTADLAMYQAKQAGRGNYQFYTAELEQRATQVLAVEARLKDALKHGDLKLHYQPVIDIKSGKLIGAEALVRLMDNDSTSLSPAAFIPVAEATGLIGNLGEWVAAEACRQQEVWFSQGLEITIAINVSPLQFRQQAFAEKLSSIISNSGMDPAYLEIEVTESAVMENMDDAVEILNKIKSLGVKVALDDFGTGYSSLSSLTKLPIDKLKVDQSFVRSIDRDQASRAVTEAIIALGHSLKIDVHGEGIESESTLRYLQEHGCSQAQGFWFSRPLPAYEFIQWYRERCSCSQVPAAKLR